MTPKQINQKIKMLELKLEISKQARNDMIFDEYKKLWNVNTWNKVKATFIYEQISKEFGLSTSMIKKVIIRRKAKK